MENYNAVDSLRSEVARFKATNTFTPMLVTNFYIQAGLVLHELDQMRAEQRRLLAECAHLGAQLDDANDNSITSDWQNEVRHAFTAAGVDSDRIDGAGCESGDPFDFTMCEIQQGINALVERAGDAEHAHKVSDESRAAWQERAEKAEASLAALPAAIIKALRDDHRCPEWANHEQGQYMLERSVSAVQKWIDAATKEVSIK